MRFHGFLGTILLCFTCLPSCNAQSGSCARGAPTLPCGSRHLPLLQLELKVNNTTYCRGDSELDGLRLDVLLTYTNVGKQQLILYKGSNLVSRIMVSRNIADLEAKRFELDSSITTIRTKVPFDDFKESVPSKYFVILPPGASYEVQGVIGVFAVRGDARVIAGAIPSGQHVVQIEVPTWPGSNEDAEEFHHQWERTGSLWYRPVISLPLFFAVEKQRRVADCP